MLTYRECFQWLLAYLSLQKNQYFPVILHVSIEITDLFLLLPAADKFVTNKIWSVACENSGITVKQFPLMTPKALPILHSQFGLDLLAQFISSLDHTVSLQHPSLDQVACCLQGEKPNSLYFQLQAFFVLYTVISRLHYLERHLLNLISWGLE